MNHDFISNLEFLIPPFYISLSFVLCIHLCNMLPHLLMDILQMFSKLFCSALLISPLSSFLNLDAVLGLFPYTIWKGDLPVLLLIELLYANFFYCKIISQPFGLSPTKHLNKFSKLRFTTSIYPLVYGWCEELNFKSIFNFFHNVRQKYPRNLISQSKTILLRRPYSLTTSLKNNSMI